jgi:hypothetical protein
MKTTPEFAPAAPLPPRQLQRRQLLWPVRVRIGAPDEC